MVVKEVRNGRIHKVEIVPVLNSDYAKITIKQFFFAWQKEKGKKVFKLRIEGTTDILGLMSIDDFESESRVEIRLLAVSSENRGASKNYENIIGNMIAFASLISLRQYGELSCISLVPKTQLVQHYIDMYGMYKAGKSLCLDGSELISLINKYNHD